MAWKSLSDKDLRIIIQASAAAGPMPYLFMLLLTLMGQRSGETVQLEWSDIDLAGKVWRRRRVGNTFPASDIPLSNLMTAILSRVAGDATPEGRIICPRGKEKTFLRFAKRVINREISARRDAPFRWSIHQPRRTFAVGCMKLGASEDTRAFLLRLYDPQPWRREPATSSAALSIRCLPVVEAWSQYVLDRVLGPRGMKFGPLDRAVQPR